MNNKVKIVIKCDGFSMRTGDLKMAEGAIDHLIRHGIMNHSWVPNGLLERAIDVIESVQRTMSELMNHVKINFSATTETSPEVADEESVVEETAKMNLIDKVKKTFTKDLNSAWTVEEDKYICDHITMKPQELAEDKDLRQRHTKDAIRTRLSVLKNNKFDRLNSDRANMLKAYVSGERVSTPIADIDRRGHTPIVDAIEKRVAKEADRTNRWTEDEITLMRDSLSLPGKKLKALFPNRTMAAVMYKKGELKGVKRQAHPRSATGNQAANAWTEREEAIIIEHAKERATDITAYLPGRTRDAILAKRAKLQKAGKISGYVVEHLNKWTKDEDNAIKLNMNMSPEQLSKLPWLKNRTLSSIAQRKFKISHEN